MVSGREIRVAFKDIRDGIASIHIWSMLGWQDIKQRYRRSKIGPFWLTISTGVLIFSMGPLYGKLLQQDPSSYFPYLAIGYVVWILISGLIVDGCNAFIGAEGYIKEIKLPLTVHVLRGVWKNLLMFAHHSAIVLLVVAIYVQKVDWHVLFVFVALAIIALNGVWIGLLFGTFCARFRDVPPIVLSLIQVVFFLTPILWKPETLGPHRWAADVNPFYHFIELVRAPFFLALPSARSVLVALATTVVGFVITLFFFSRFRSRIAYWM
jgi:ABC-type polysaccharide/polyol phosphate export permease